MLNFEITHLYTHQGISSIHKQFCHFLSEQNQGLYQEMQSIIKYDPDFSLQLAIYIEKYITKLFNIKNDVEQLTNWNHSFINIHKCKREFIQRYALRQYDKVTNFTNVTTQLKKALNTDNITETLFADTVMKWWSNREQNSYQIELAAQYACWMVQNSNNSTLFNIPKKLDYSNLINTTREITSTLKSPTITERDGFQLTDNGLKTITAVNNAKYCIYCHKQKKDSCSHGLYNKDGTHKVSPTKTLLSGCPLNEKISEMNLLKSQGHNIAALAIITLDNPMCAATGHRICNDCMRSCIYQKQTPVNVPGIETNVLGEVLSLPYGFEIYSLLTRWNPLNWENPTPKPDSHRKVLIAGLGPAGFTMVHYLLNEGHTIVAIDGLKIEPLPSHITGVKSDGTRTKFNPIKNIKTLYEELDNRVIQGFGGVTEYGITVRWNKNYLKIIRIILERRNNLLLHGGVRFGSNITYEDAKQLGFQHIALAIGAGRPNIVKLKNNFVNGVRMASDFLMSLQLSGAYKRTSMANLQIRMPIVVIGGGLTAIDTATEALHYYSIQVEKFAHMYETLKHNNNKDDIQDNWTEVEKEIANEFLHHAQLLKQSSSKITTLISLGGSTILYRKTLQESPAYRLNHEEVEKALEEGIKFIENFTPHEIVTDKNNNACMVNGLINNQETSIPAKTVLIAAGTHPNSILSQENPSYFSNFINKTPEDITIIGDVNPQYSGSVVKAIASSKDSYKQISTKLAELAQSTDQDFLHTLHNKITARVVNILTLTTSIYELVIRSPLAARNFHPGQFYRLQNYESNAANINGIKMLIEPLALTGAKVDKDAGTVSLIVLNVGASSELCAKLKIGEKVVLMGPTGTPTEIPYNETVMLIGGGLGNAVLFSIGQAMKKNNCKVLYCAGYKKAEDRYKIDEIEKAADAIIWACDEKKLTVTRQQDFTFNQNIVDSITSYHHNTRRKIDLLEIDRVIAIGSDGMMHAVQQARNTNWKKYFKKNTKFIASINSPMQCMMKEICAQCLQKHIDPETGKETFVYSCHKQDQDMNYVDFGNLRSRLQQNSVQEKLSSSIIKNATQKVS